MAYANYSASHAAPSGSAVLAKIQTFVSRKFANYREWSEKRAGLRSLRNLDGHILRDIGLSNEQVRPHDPFAHVYARYRNNW